MNDTNEKIDKKITSVIINKSDSIVAISGLFANVGVFGVTIRNKSKNTNTNIIYTPQGTPVPQNDSIYENIGTGFYTTLIIFALFITYGLWNFKAWGWLITVLFSVICIFLVVPDILNYHAALVSMILLSYITNPSVRNKYIN